MGGKGERRGKNKKEKEKSYGAKTSITAVLSGMCSRGHIDLTTYSFYMHCLC